MGGHPSEGFALAWSPSAAAKGQMLTGDGSNNIYHWQPTDGSSWRVDAVPFVGHTDSVWDLRSFGGGKPAAHFKWHTSPITSVEWHPREDSMPAVSEAKCATTAWDMSLEADDEAKLDDTTG